MRRVVFLFGISCLVVVCCVGTRLASDPPIGLLLPRDATDIHVDAIGWWEWMLSYRTPGPAYAWYFTVTHQLEAGGWTPVERRTGGPLRNPVAYTQLTSFGFAGLVQRVELDGDLDVVHIRMRRQISLPWWHD